MYIETNLASSTGSASCRFASARLIRLRCAVRSVYTQGRNFLHNRRVVGKVATGWWCSLAALVNRLRGKSVHHAEQTLNGELGFTLVTCLPIGRKTCISMVHWCAALRLQLKSLDPSSLTIQLRSVVVECTIDKIFASMK